MTLGALVAILVIALGALQLPRLFKTKASGAGQVTQQAAATSTTPASPISQPANPAESQPQQPVSGPASQTQVTPLASSTPAKQTLPPTASTKQPRRVAGAQATAEREQTNATPPPASGAPAGTAAPVNPPVQAAQSPAEDASAAKELEELEDRMTPLEGRAGAVKDSVDHLRQQQESAGYSLRQDMSASASNMQQYMGKAQDALNAKNPQAAKKYMDLAEREVEKLEKFFGR